MRRRPSAGTFSPASPFGLGLFPVCGATALGLPPLPCLLLPVTTATAFASTCCCCAGFARGAGGRLNYQPSGTAQVDAQNMNE